MPTQVTVYASDADLLSAINPSALNGVGSTVRKKALEDASAEIDDYLRAQFTLPLIDTGSALRRHCANIAVYWLMVGRGYNPEAGGDAGIETRYKMALSWLKDVRDGKVIPGITDSSSSAAKGVPSAQPLIYSSSSRGFSGRSSNPADRWPFQGD